MNGRRSRTTIIVLAVVLAVVIVFVVVYYVLVASRSDRAMLKWALNIIDEYYYEDVDIDPSETDINAIVSKYLDRYSAYYTPEELDEQLSSDAGNKTGVGIGYNYVRGKGAVIGYVMGNSPAYESGLRKGVCITSGSRGGEHVEFDSSSSMTVFMDAAEVGEEFVLYDENGRAYTMSREAYTASYVYLATNSCGYSVSYDEYGEPSVSECVSDAIEYLPDGAGYISLLQFYGNSVDEFGMMLEKFYELGCDVMYLDLRNDGGGYVNVMQYISGYFVDSSNIAMSAVYKSGKITEYTVCEPSKSVRVDGDTKVYVLANLNTASASEALIGVLVSYGVVDYGDIFISLFGDEYVEWSGTEKNGRTYGKGIMQQTYRNSSTGAGLKLTVARIYWPDGTTIHDRGLSGEDGCRLVDAYWTVTESDEELESVVDMTCP